MQILRKIKQFFSPEEKEVFTTERSARELLRENLGSFSVDMFDQDDPIISMSPADRKSYLKYFHSIMTDKKIIQRLQYLINKQANLTLKHSKEGVFDVVGSSTLNGIAVAKNDIERLSAMFEKESAEPPAPEVQQLQNFRGI